MHELDPPARRSAAAPASRRPRRRDLLLACSGLELQGGGRALLARLLASGCASYASQAGVGFSILSLGRPDPDYQPPAPVWYASGGRSIFERSGVARSTLARSGFARRVLTAQVRSRRTALVFDLLGPSRVQNLLPRPLLAPYLLTLLGIEVWRPLRSSESLALSRATTRLAISHATLERAEPYLPRGIECEVLHLALEERKPAGEADARLLEQLAEGFLLIVGRMASEESYKGHDQLLEALSLVSSASEPPHLVIAGGGDDRERLESRARELGVRSRVTFTGHVSEATLAALYQRCCLFVMPSRGEGFGLVYLEAMRAGKPCIAARDTAAQEIVVDGLTGLLIGADQPTELARGIERLMADSATRRSFGEAGQQRYREQFSYERFEADLHRHLDRLTVLPSAPHTVAP